MAYVIAEEEELEDPRGPRGGGPQTIPGTVPSGGRPTPQSPQSPTPGAQSTDFVSWDRILSANKDAATASAQKMGDKMQAAGKAVKTSLGAAQEKFNQGVNAGTPSQAQPKLTQGPVANSFGQPTKTPQVQMPAGATPAPQQMPEPVMTTDAKYTGPNSLSEDAGWEGILSAGKEAGGKINATQRRDGMGGLRGEGGVEALLKEGASGNYSAGASGMDAALVSGQGRRRFGELQKEYGGLVKDARAADTASIGQSDIAKARVAASNAEAQRISDARTAKSQADIQAKLAERAKYDAERARLTGPQGQGKAEDWKAYTENNRFENTLHDFGREMDIPGKGVEAITGTHPLDKVNDGFEGYANENLGMSVNSRKFNWGPTGPLGGVPDDVKQYLYEALSAEELHAMERMSGDDAQTYAIGKIKELRESAKAALEELGGTFDMSGGLAMGSANYAKMLAGMMTKYKLSEEQVRRLIAIAGYKIGWSNNSVAEA